MGTYEERVVPFIVTITFPHRELDEVDEGVGSSSLQEDNSKGKHSNIGSSFFIILIFSLF